MPMEILWIIIAVVAAIIVLTIFFTFVPLGLWISAMAAGVRVGIFTLIGMRIRRVVPSRIVNPMIKAVKAGLDVQIDKLEAHYLAGGNVDRVINALIAAQRADINGPPPSTWPGGTCSRQYRCRSTPRSSRPRWWRRSLRTASSCGPRRG